MDLKEMKHLVATRVMGYAEVDGMYSDNGGKTRCNLNYISDYPEYISAAWKVAERFDKIKLESFEDGYSVEILKYLDFEGVFITLSYGHGKTAPLAICNAALEAVGVTVNE